MIANYSEFLLENELNVGLLNASYNFVPRLVNDAKKNKLLQKSNPDSKSTWYKRELEFDLELNNKRGRTSNVIITKAGSLVAIFLLQVKKEYHKDDKNIENALNPADIIVVSHNSFDIADIELVLAETVKGTYKNKTYVFTRKLIDDNSRSEKPLDNKVYVRWDPNRQMNIERTDKIDLFYARYEYDLKIIENEKLTVDKIEKSPAYVDLVSNFPLVDVSTASQHKKVNIMLAIPKDMILDTDDEYTKQGDKYADWGFGLYSTGYVRNIPMYSDSSSQYYNQPRVSVIGTFDATTIEGWSKGIEIVKKRLIKIKNDLASRKGVLICTPEEKHRYRGHIAGKRMGI